MARLQNVFICFPDARPRQLIKLVKPYVSQSKDGVILHFKRASGFAVPFKRGVMNPSGKFAVLVHGMTEKYFLENIKSNNSVAVSYGKEIIRGVDGHPEISHVTSDNILYNELAFLNEEYVTLNKLAQKYKADLDYMNKPIPEMLLSLFSMIEKGHEVMTARAETGFPSSPTPPSIGDEDIGKE